MIVRADVEVVSPHTLTVVPHLLGLSTRKHRATIRGRALDALRGLTVLPYHKVCSYLVGWNVRWLTRLLALFFLLSSCSLSRSKWLQA